jgi:mannonate dehydratase
MKLGMGLYPDILTQENFRFAKQMGAEAIVAHLPGYSQTGKRPVKPDKDGHWPVWTYEELRDLKAAINAEGLELAAIENFEVDFWYDVLLDGPRRAQQMEGLKTIIRNMGKAGIPIMGYNFSLAGVWGRTWRDNVARGHARTIGYVEADAPPQDPIPNGMVWNTVYDEKAPPGFVAPITSEELWRRLAEFLKEMVPVAEEAGVRLAAHPDDPPLETLRGQPRLVYKPELYQRLLDIYPSYYNALEFCQGTISEMRGEMDVYEAIERYSRQGNIAYVHFRNVKGKVPNYHEVFIDEGDVDMIKALRLYHKNGFDGLMIPDHTPEVSCAAPWHAGIAYALGYMKAAIRMVEEE